MMVKKVKEWDDGNVTFNLLLDNGIEIYGLRMVTWKDKRFVSFPRKKSGSEFINTGFIPNDVQEKVMMLIEAELTEEEFEDTQESYDEMDYEDDDDDEEFPF